MNGTEMGVIESIISSMGAPGIVLLFLGAPSVVMCFMYADHRRYERERLDAAKADAVKQLEHQAALAEQKEQLLAIIAQQDRRFEAVVAQQDRRFEIVVKHYENNVVLVEGYQKLAGDLAGIIHISTQVLTKLVEKIENNLYCPMMKEKR